MDEILTPAQAAEIARHVLAGECPYHVEISCECFTDCSECWWWHLTREEVR